MTTTHTAAAAATTVITEVPLEQLHESPFNQRQRFAVDDLAASIRAEGRVLEPLLVRPRIANILRPDEHDGYEIVFGHRRLRAAEAAGLATVPCMVRALTDAEARSAQIAENLERDDVHPLEEAASFRALVDDDGLTPDQIAERYGKSRSYVYGRLKLLHLHPEVRAACLAGEVGAEVALLLARLRTEKLQAKALAAIKADYHCKLDDGGKASYRHVQELLNERFTLALKDAIFDTVDALLLPDAGACTTCPKRTANAPEYDDITHGEKLPSYSKRHHGPEVCTDPDCFDEKKKAHLALRAKELEAKGKTVVAGNAARAAISAKGDVKGAFVALKDVKAELDKATKIAGRQRLTLSGKPVEPPPIFTIQDPRTGKTVQAVRRADLPATVAKKHEPKARDDTYERDEARRKAERAAADAKAAAEQRVRMAVFERIRAAAATRERSAFDLQLAAKAAIAGVEWAGREVLARLWGRKDTYQLGKGLDQMPVEQLTQLILDCALVGDIPVRAWSLDHKPETLLSAARHYGIDVAAVRAELAEPPGAGVCTPPPAAPATKNRKSAARPARASTKPGAVKYRCPATDSTWSGRGLQPAWVKAALANGRTLAELQATAPSPAKTPIEALQEAVAGEEVEA